MNELQKLIGYMRRDAAVLEAMSYGQSHEAGLKRQVGVACGLRLNINNLEQLLVSKGFTSLMNGDNECPPK